MRLGSLIFVGISLLGCKDPDSAKPAAHGSAAAQVAKSVTPAPSLGSAAGSDTEEKAWAEATVKEINAVAPELKDVSCAQKQCRATLTAASQDELVEKTDRLQTEESLRQLDARGVLLSGAPEQKDGAYKVTLYVKFDR